MSANPVYSIDLVNASDMSVIEKLTGIGPATSRSLNPIFNSPGSFSSIVPLDSRVARLVKKRSTGVLVKRDDEFVWSGGVTVVKHSGDIRTTSITATGWMEEFDHRYVRKDEESLLSFPDPGVPGGEIIQTLMEVCNLQLDSDGNTRPLRMRFGTVGDTQPRIRSYKVGDNYGAAIRELITIEDGCDLVIDWLARVVSTVDPGAFVDRTEVKFGYDVFPHNLDDFEINDDGTNLANRVNAVGSNGIVFPADDSIAISDAGVMLEDWLSVGNVSDPDIVGAYANAELVYKRYGLTTYSLKVKPFGNVPRIYAEFRLGDQVYASSDRGAMVLKNQAVRVFGASIDISDGGDEILSELQVAP